MMFVICSLGGIMRSTDIDFAFPVMAFTPDKEIWGFPDLNRLTRCGPTTVPKGRQIGMELIDAKLRRWVVRSVERIGPAELFLKGLVRALLTGTPQSRIAQDVEPLESVSLRDVQDMACVSLNAFPDDYGLSDLVERDAMLAEVRKTTSLQELFDLLTPDTFESY